VEGSLKPANLTTAHEAVLILHLLPDKGTHRLLMASAMAERAVRDCQKQQVASLPQSHPGHIANRSTLVVLVASARVAKATAVLRFPRYSL